MNLALFTRVFNFFSQNYACFISIVPEFLQKIGKGFSGCLMIDRCHWKALEICHLVRINWQHFVTSDASGWSENFLYFPRAVTYTKLKVGSGNWWRLHFSGPDIFLGAKGQGDMGQMLKDGVVVGALAWYLGNFRWCSGPLPQKALKSPTAWGLPCILLQTEWLWLNGLILFPPHSLCWLGYVTPFGTLTWCLGSS